MSTPTTVLIDCRKLGRLEACEKARRLAKSEPGLRLVAIVNEDALSVGWMLGFDAVITDARFAELLEAAS